MYTNEGAAAVKNAINFLNSQAPRSALNWANGLSRACQDHVNDIGPKGLTQHNGSDGSSPKDRMLRYGSWGSSWAYAENLDFGTWTGQEDVLALIIDDGVSNRGHRTNIFSSSYSYIGVASGSHKKYGQMACQDFAKTYTSKVLMVLLV